MLTHNIWYFENFLWLCDIKLTARSVAWTQQKRSLLAFFSSCSVIFYHNREHVKIEIYWSLGFKFYVISDITSLISKGFFTCSHFFNVFYSSQIVSSCLFLTDFNKSLSKLVQKSPLKAKKPEKIFFKYALRSFAVHA